MTNKQISALRKIVAAMSKGSWTVDDHTDAGDGRSVGPVSRHVRVSTPCGFTDGVVYSVTRQQRDADAAGIAALVNAADELLDAARRDTTARAKGRTRKGGKR